MIAAVENTWGIEGYCFKTSILYGVAPFTPANDGD